MAGVRIVDQPLPESCWVAVMREALKPWATGMIPAGPWPLSVTTWETSVLAMACAAALAGLHRRARDAMKQEAMTPEAGERGVIELRNTRGPFALTGLQGVGRKGMRRLWDCGVGPGRGEVGRFRLCR